MENKFKIAVSIVAVIFIALLGLFAYNKYGSEKNSPLNFLHGYLPHWLFKEEEKNIKSLSENFVLRYGNYVLGNFSGLISLQNQMTPELWAKKSVSMDAQKKAIAGQPKRYITFSAPVKKSNIVFYDYNKGEAEIEVEYLQIEIKGAYIPDDKTLKYVDEFGEEKPIPPPIETSKKIRLKLIKENNEWKVDDIIPVQ